MVRINLINPKNLTDQHLVAEYLEILMLAAYARKYSPEKVENYCLGKGHIKFFHNKLVYLKKRHELIKKEMRMRGFATNKTLDIKNFKKSLKKNWRPKEKDVKLIKQRIIDKISLKPEFYRYYSKNMPKKFLIKLTKNANTRTCTTKKK